jgi:hypothetical protein
MAMEILQHIERAAHPAGNGALFSNAMSTTSIADVKSVRDYLIIGALLS